MASRRSGGDTPTSRMDPSSCPFIPQGTTTAAQPSTDSPFSQAMQQQAAELNERYFEQMQRNDRRRFEYIQAQMLGAASGLNHSAQIQQAREYDCELRRQQARQQRPRTGPRYPRYPQPQNQQPRQTGSWRPSQYPQHPQPAQDAASWRGVQHPRPHQSTTRPGYPQNPQPQQSSQHMRSPQVPPLRPQFPQPQQQPQQQLSQPADTAPPQSTPYPERAERPERAQSQQPRYLPPSQEAIPQAAPLVPPGELLLQQPAPWILRESSTSPPSPPPPSPSVETLASRGLPRNPPNVDPAAWRFSDPKYSPPTSRFQERLTIAGVSTPFNKPARIKWQEPRNAPQRPVQNNWQQPWNTPQQPQRPEQNNWQQPCNAPRQPQRPVQNNGQRPWNTPQQPQQPQQPVNHSERRPSSQQQQSQQLLINALRAWTQRHLRQQAQEQEQQQQAQEQEQQQQAQEQEQQQQLSAPNLPGLEPCISQDTTTSSSNNNNGGGGKNNNNDNNNGSTEASQEASSTPQTSPDRGPDATATPNPNSSALPPAQMQNAWRDCRSLWQPPRRAREDPMDDDDIWFREDIQMWTNMGRPTDEQEHTSEPGSARSTTTIVRAS